MPAKLRTKTGCFACRLRKKKCDEARPICQGCRARNRRCLWPDETRLTMVHAKTHKFLGSMWAKLCSLSPVYCKHKPYAPDRWQNIHFYPLRPSLVDWQPFRSDTEYSSFTMLSRVLFTMMTPKYQRTCQWPGIEFTIGMQELWVRDALLAAATFFSLACTENALTRGPHAYYLTTVSAIKVRIQRPVDELPLEELLVAALFMQMLEIHDPFQTAFPTPHSLAIARILQLLHDRNAGRTLSPQIEQFHRICLELYIYYIAMQSFFYSDNDHFIEMIDPYGQDHATTLSSPDINVIKPHDINVSIILNKLVRLALPSSLTSAQIKEAELVNGRIQAMETATSTRLKEHDATTIQSDVYYYTYTDLSWKVLKIYVMKIQDRTLSSSDARLRPLVTSALSRLEECKPPRAWNAEYIWIFAILLCAADTIIEYERLSTQLSRFNEGFWCADVNRARGVFYKIKTTREAWLKRLDAGSESSTTCNTLDLLVEGRLSLRKASTTQNIEDEASASSIPDALPNSNRMTATLKRSFSDVEETSSSSKRLKPTPELTEARSAMDTERRGGG